MKNTKIMVFSLKDIIRSTVLFVTGLIILLFIIFMFLPKNDQEVQSSKYIPGEYTSEIILNDSKINVVVVVDEYEILDVLLLDLNETQEVFYPLLKPTMVALSESIIRNQSTSVETSAISIETTKILLTAVDDALSKAIIIK